MPDLWIAVGPGGGRVGAVMFSPCIRPGTVSDTASNHYSTLRWVEDNFGLAIWWRRHLPRWAASAPTSSPAPTAIPGRP